ncbi:hypothetical protein [Antarcticibacterium sp. 1MA-6-2]|uniref:hypothetical protein n=1 Tax=Antarcticibacterium sp. 1MA-6-2 TaxID=2908210 RepID=UPI0038FD1DF2
MWGISLEEVQQRFGNSYLEYLMEQAQGPLRKELLIIDGDKMQISDKGKFLSDGIAADLFLVNLDEE